MNLARSSLKLFVANVGSAAIQFLGIAYFARELGPSALGVFFLFQASLGLLSIPADFGLRGAVEKRISEGSSAGEYLTAALVLKTVPVIVISGSILLLSPILNDYLGADLSTLLVLAILLNELSMLSIVILKGEFRVGETAILRLAQKSTWVGIGAMLISYGYRELALVYGLLAGMTVMLLWGWYKTSTVPRLPSVEHVRSLFDYGKFNVVSSIGGYVYSWMDVIVIGLFLTQAHVGAYEVAWRLSAVAMLFSNAIAATIFPQVSEWDAQGARERIENLLPRVITPSLLLVVPAFFGTVVLSIELLEYIFGTQFSTAWIVLILLMGDKVFQAVQIIIGKSLQAIDEPDLAARATIISVVLNGILNVLFILEFGIIGAAVATVTSSVVNDLLHYNYLRKFIQISFEYREIAECFVAAGGMCVVLLIYESWNPVNGLEDLIITVILGVLSYAVFIVLSPTLRPRIKQISQQLNADRGAS